MFDYDDDDDEYEDRRTKSDYYNPRSREFMTTDCFYAEINDDGKYFCPECKKVEGGTLRIITHTGDCKNKGLDFCQYRQYHEYQSAGRKRRRNKTNKKTKKSKKQKKSTKVRKSRHHRKH